MIAVVDNYDSFTFNLVHDLRALAVADDVRVVRNDAAEVAEIVGWGPSVIVVSPGPGVPEHAGVSVGLFDAAAGVPILGVCLGHQALAYACGGRVVRAPVPRHGKVSAVHHDGSALFAGVDDPFQATRYHSLVADRSSLPGELAVTAWSDDGLVMAMAHRRRPHYGVQFHPESYLTQGGRRMLANFLEISGVAIRRPA